MSTPAPPPVRDRRRSSRALLGTGVGNALEWYDWNIYASFAIFISAQLFDSENPASALLKTLAIFAVGFVARPFGGYVFGWLADRIGRKHSLMLAVICASVGSLMIALCPPYAQIGAAASVILLVARLIQGLAHGGELPSAQTYLSEQAPPEKRGFWSSSIYVSGTVGLLAGMLLGLLLNGVLSAEAMQTWGWRVPFFIGAFLGIFAIWIRNRMDESEVFEHELESGNLPKESVIRGVWRHRGQAVRVIGMTAGLTVSYYVWSVAMTPYATKTLGFTTQNAFIASIIGNIAFIVSLPLWGLLSDRIGRKPVMLFSMVGGAVLYVPMLALVHSEVWQLTLAIAVMCVVLGAYLAIAPAAYAEMFPTEVRATGFGVPYAIAIAAFGGTAAYVQTWMATAFEWKWAFPAYAIVLMLISAATIFTLPETKGRDLNDG
ncbi:MFS transporter [Gephyromycinifex aptenodytis]|uniref:MFS transporter n=1 Tax=Gephyromycinifex aptenodytis TaxID=2716227 RepID=UPI0014473B3F|nr:MFS transporter [Gephyromycinifex aptenodytis]